MKSVVLVKYQKGLHYIYMFIHYKTLHVNGIMLHHGILLVGVLLKNKNNHLHNNKYKDQDTQDALLVSILLLTHLHLHLHLLV